MDTQTPNSARGEVQVQFGGKARQLRFGMNTLHDYSKLTGSPVAGFAKDLLDDFQPAVRTITYCAIKRYVPAAELPDDFSQDTVGDWLDELSPEDGETLAEALYQSVKTGNPMVAALIGKIVPPTAPTEHASTPATTAGTTS